MSSLNPQSSVFDPPHRLLTPISPSILSSDVVGDMPDVQECVARCDWTAEDAPLGGLSNIRPLHSYDEMNEWHLSNSDLAQIDNM